MAIKMVLSVQTCIKQIFRLEYEHSSNNHKHTFQTHMRTLEAASYKLRPETTINFFHKSWHSDINKKSKIYLYLKLLTFDGSKLRFFHYKITRHMCYIHNELAQQIHPSNVTRWCLKPFVTSFVMNRANFPHYALIALPKWKCYVIIGQL